MRIAISLLLTVSFLSVAKAEEPSDRIPPTTQWFYQYPFGKKPIRHSRRHYHHVHKTNRKETIKIAATKTVTIPKSIEAVGKPSIFARYEAAQNGPTTELPSSVRTALARVEASCSGFKITSTFRPNAVVARSRKRSLHADKLAADFQVKDYRCAYKALADWKFGLSVDAWRVNHIHISDGRRIGKNEGRFAHGRRATRYARRHRFNAG